MSWKKQHSKSNANYSANKEERVMSYSVITSTLAFIIASVALIMIVSTSPWAENSTPVLPSNPGSQSSSGSAVESCISAYRDHTHTYKATNISHSHSLEQDWSGSSYRISEYRSSPWLNERSTSAPEGYC